MVQRRRPGFPLSNEEIDGFVGRSAALGGFLRGGEATNIVTAYEREDQRAIEAQGRFSNVATRLNRTVLVTAGIGALILALGVLQPWLQQHDSTHGSIRSPHGLWPRLVSSGSSSAAMRRRSSTS